MIEVYLKYYLPLIIPDGTVVIATIVIVSPIAVDNLSRHTSLYGITLYIVTNVPHGIPAVLKHISFNGSDGNMIVPIIPSPISIADKLRTPGTEKPLVWSRTPGAQRPKILNTLINVIASEASSLVNPESRIKSCTNICSVKQVDDPNDNPKEHIMYGLLRSKSQSVRHNVSVSEWSSLVVSSSTGTWIVDTLTSTVDGAPRSVVAVRFTLTCH